MTDSDFFILLQAIFYFGLMVIIGFLTKYIKDYLIGILLIPFMPFIYLYKTLNNIINRNVDNIRKKIDNNITLNKSLEVFDYYRFVCLPKVVKSNRFIDSSKLKYSKKEILDSGLFIINQTTDYQQKEIIKGALYSLIDFQDNIGEEDLYSPFYDELANNSIVENYKNIIQSDDTRRYLFFQKKATNELHEIKKLIEFL